ncbi:hypothetical protein NMG60_11002589 [Bertholletia excelsa]
MEATSGVEDLLSKIRPPRLEDAGLEDCALPPESIKEAFLKAATAVGSRAASIFGESEDDDEEGCCMKDPWPEAVESSDTLVGISEGIEPPSGSCSNEKGGGLPDVVGDEVAAGLTEAKEMVDKVVGAPDVPEGEKACVDGLRGLKIGDQGDGKGEKSENGDEDKKDGEEERPILVETFVQNLKST